MNEVAEKVTESGASIMERVLLTGDLSKLTSRERVDYYAKVCESVGLNPLTKPFAYITLNGKLTLYALRDATDQLRKLHGVSLTIKERTERDGVCVVTATAVDKSGRVDESTGAVSIQNLRGEALCNALMKAETKAKRRVTLSIVGLGMLDETELDTITEQTSAEVAPITEDQAANLQALIEEVDANKTKFMKYLGVMQLGDLPSTKYADAVAALERKRQAQ